LGGTYQAAMTDDATPYGWAALRFTGPSPQVGSLITRGLVDFSPAAGGPVTLTLDSLALVPGGGTLSGTDSIAVTGPFTWRSGTVAVPRLEAQGGMAMSLEANAPGLTLSGTDLINDAAASVTVINTVNSGFTLAGGATFENRGTLTLNEHAVVADSGDHSAILLRNTGTIVAGTPSSAGINVPIDSSGPIIVSSGELDLGDTVGGGGRTFSFSGPINAAPGTWIGFLPTGGTVNVAGDVNAAGARVDFNAGTYTLSGAYQSGISNVIGAVRFTGSSADVGVLTGGTAELGTTAPITATATSFSGGLTGHGYMALHDAGAFTLTGSLHLGLNGHPGSGHYDTITADGPVSLNGVPFSLEIGAGFNACDSGVYTLIDGPGNAIGQFAGLPDGQVFSAGGNDFRISYANGDVTLTTVATPIAVTLASSANPAILGQLVTFTATVTTAGVAQSAGSVQFQVDGVNVGSPVPLVNGTASYSTAALTAGSHVVTAAYSMDCGCPCGSAGQITQIVHYQFGGFLPPLDDDGSYKLGRDLPIKFRLMDYNGNAVTTVSAVRSLQVQAIDAQGQPTGTPFNPTTTAGTALRYDPVSQQFIFNWDTSGLTLGYYRVLLTLDDGTLWTLDLRLK
jgi:hypothetical protein